MKLYIDPGTGSMLFAILIGTIGALNYILKNGLLKLKFLKALIVLSTTPGLNVYQWKRSRDVGIFLAVLLGALIPSAVIASSP